MSSKWDFVKNLGKKQKSSPDLLSESKPRSKTPPPTRSNDIELGEATSQPGVFEKVKTTLRTNLLTQKAKNMTEGVQERVQTSINFSKNLPYIIVLCAAGVFFMIVAFVFLPLVLLVPHKFSMSFAIGGFCFLSAIALCKDPMKFYKSLIQGDMLKWSVLYMISIFGTLGAALAFKSRPFALGFAIAQVVSLSWIIAVSVPGGKALMRGIQMAIRKCCQYLADAITR